VSGPIADREHRAAVLARLLQGSTRVWRGRDLAAMDEPGCATGFAALDALLPGGGWPAGVLTELLPSHEGIGELQLLVPALARLARAGERVVWIAPPHEPHAPALVRLGLDPSQVLVVRPDRRRDLLWSAEQTLRTGAAGALLLWPQAIRDARALQYAELRRLQLAAEGTRTLALMFRPAVEASAVSCAALRIALAPTGDGRLALDILKRRGGLATGLANGPSLVLDIGPERGRVRSRTEAPGNDLAGHPLAAPPGRIDRRGEFIT
jgi:hypothetical protein